MITRKTALIVLMIAAAAALTSCGEDDSISGDNINIYYTDSECSKLVTEEYDLSYVGEDESGDYTENMIYEVLTQLALDDEDEEKISVIPDELEIKDFSCNEKIAVIDFSGDYSAIENNAELMLRAGTVLTLTQIEGVSAVTFTNEGEAIMLKQGQYANGMKADDFVIGASDEETGAVLENFDIYFASESGDLLKICTLEDVNRGDLSQEEYVLEKLIEGPEDEGYLRTLSPNIKVQSVTTANNICYVDFDSSFLTEQEYVDSTLAIYSIVNTLCSLSDVHEVQISVSSDSSVLYHDTVDLSAPLQRDLTIVESDTGS